MQDWLAIVLLWLLFAATHMGMSSRRLRPVFVDRFGRGGFMGVYSLVALIVFVPLVWVWLDALHSGPALWVLVDHTVVRWVAMVLAAVGVIGAVSAYFQISPVAFVPGIPATALGLTRITRHPLFMFAALWAFAHCLLFGFATDLAFFGGFVVFGIVGCAHQDARKLAEEPERFGPFMQETSLLPFVAILSGRNKLVLGELPLLGMAVGLVMAIGLYLLHPVMF